jgi:nucleoside-diphosphate-sugar epimerase
MNAPHVLVAGATGIVGRRVVERFGAEGSRVTGLCRRPPVYDGTSISVDLTDTADCRAKLAAMSDVTHFIYAARDDHPEGSTESIDTNAAMLRNAVEALEPAAQRLRHVHLVHGTKYYGHMLGPLPVPLSEDSPRARVPNFYFEHEDWIRERSCGKAWTYSTSRPHTFGDADASEPRNLALLIAVYASLARELGRPLIFPGTEKAFEARTQFTYVPLLADVIFRIATDPPAANASYNITNGDAPRWSSLWPEFAKYFGVMPGPARALRLADYIADKAHVWHALTQRHRLESVSLDSRVLWPYADYVFKPEWDIVSSTENARRAGYMRPLDSAQMFVTLFDELRANKIIP